MADKRSTASASIPMRPKHRRSPIPEPFQRFSSATIPSGTRKIKVPMLVLYGEWLKAVGFPIGSAVYVTTDRNGELALRRLGLGVPRQIRIRATPLG